MNGSIRSTEEKKHVYTVQKNKTLNIYFKVVLYGTAAFMTFTISILYGDYRVKDTQHINTMIVFKRKAYKLTSNQHD